jgi:glycosyltransferase involved in cell wall biosynthesis
MVISFRLRFPNPKLSFTGARSTSADLSILMVLYNKGRYLNRSMPSIFSLPISPHRIEIICVDDASTDNTRHVVGTYQRLDTRIWLHAIPTNVGTHRSRITAVLLVRTPFLTFLDPDDQFTGQGLSIALETIIEKDGDISEFGCHTVTPEKTFKYCWLPPRITQAVPERYKSLYYRGKVNCHVHRKIFRTALYQDAIHSMPAFVLQSRILRYEDKLHYAFILDKMTRNFYYTRTLGEYRYWGLEDNSQSSTYQSVNASIDNDHYVSWIINTTFGRFAK